MGELMRTRRTLVNSETMSFCSGEEGITLPSVIFALSILCASLQYCCSLLPLVSTFKPILSYGSVFAGKRVGKIGLNRLFAASSCSFCQLADPLIRSSGKGQFLHRFGIRSYCAALFVADDQRFPDLSSKSSIPHPSTRDSR